MDECPCGISGAPRRGFPPVPSVPEPSPDPPSPPWARLPTNVALVIVVIAGVGTGGGVGFEQIAPPLSRPPALRKATRAAPAGGAPSRPRTAIAALPKWTTRPVRLNVPRVEIEACPLGVAAGAADTARGVCCTQRRRLQYCQ